MNSSCTCLSVTNQKGGVGKTTTAVNLAASLAEMGRKILLVDCDAQGNATAGLGVAASRAGLYDVLLDGVQAAHAIVRTSAQGVDLLPSSPDLSGAELELLERDDRNGLLRNALEEVRGWYSHIILDCPPALALLTINALAASDAAVVPVQCEYLALEGLVRLMTTLDRVRETANPDLRVLGLLMTMYDGRTMLSHQVTAEVRRHFPALTFSSVIPRNVRLGEAPSFGKSILDYDPSSRGAQAYRELAREVVERCAAGA